MATLDQILLRLPRKAPDADFMDRLFGQIRGVGTLVPAPSIAKPDLFLLEPTWFEPVQSDMQAEAVFTQSDANLHPLPVMQKEAFSDICRFTKFSP